MIRYYHYQLHNQIRKNDFFSALLQSGSFDLEHFDIDCDTGCFIAEDETIISLEQCIPSLIQDFDYGIRIMSSFSDTSFMRYLFNLSFQLEFKHMYYYYEVLFQALLDHDQTSINYLHQIISKLTREDIETLRMYMQCSMNANRASSALFIHRNTFHYRINRILDKTGIDFKDFNNMLLFTYCDMITKK